MNKKKYLLLFVAIGGFGAGAYFSEPSFLSSSQSSATSLAAQGDTLAAQSATSAKLAGIDFTLLVGRQNYLGTVKAGATVLDAMRALASSDNFRFTGKNYQSLGFFVESVNGKKNSNDVYWILYINGKQSDAGASQTTIHSGDAIEWRYEKGID